jgi:hypothetical protein
MTYPQISTSGHRLSPIVALGASRSTGRDRIATMPGGGGGCRHDIEGCIG